MPHRRGLLLLVLLAGWAWISAGRVVVWQSESSLWADAVATDPLAPLAWLNVGYARSQAGAVAEAEAAYRRAAELATRDPRWDRVVRTMAETNLGAVLARTGRPLEALRLWNGVLHRYPGYALARFNRAMVYASAGRCDLARRDFRIAAVIDASYWPSVNPCPEP